jgi:hypothetical protein
VLEQMSLFADGFWEFNSPNLVPDQQMQGLNDWQDEIAAALLTKDDKEAILAMQRSNGLALSRF